VKKSNHIQSTNAEIIHAIVQQVSKDVETATGMVAV